MPLTPYQPLFERVLAFATAPRFEEELKAARSLFLRATGETFEEDRSFDARAQAFLDWYVFDRPLSEYGEVPVRAFALSAEGAAERDTLRAFSRTVHGLFVATAVEASGVSLRCIPTGAEYLVEEKVVGLKAGEIFEGRLVPWNGKLWFSPAFLFHPRFTHARLVQWLRRARRDGCPPALQELTWEMARMASRVEHYSRLQPETVYDFAKPPPMVERAPARRPRRLG